MEMTGEVRIDAPRETVWAALNDPEVLKASIPGCTELTRDSDTEMSATVQAKVGMVRATFKGTVTLSNIDAPNSYTITGEGKGGVAGFAKGGADVTLVPDGEATLVKYVARGQVGGKLAQVGGRLIDATAKQMADAFFKSFAEKVAPAARAEDMAEIAEVLDENTPEPVRRELAFERAEHAVEQVVEEAEEEVEKAAVRNFLGGPQMWGLIALLVVVVIIIVAVRQS